MTFRCHPLFFCTLFLLIAFTGIRITAVFLLFCLAHEMGHFICMARFHVPVHCVTLSPGGITIAGDFSHCGYKEEAIIHSMGIAVNILLMCIFRILHKPLYMEMNLLLACYNSLPLPGHDGAKLLHAILGLADETHREYGMRIMIWMAHIMEAVFYVFAAWLFWFCALRDPSAEALLCGTMFWTVLNSISHRFLPFQDHTYMEKKQSNIKK
ncbi:MAG: hypothetical protein J6I50_01230 [Clostridia bacterium]|nr:hypothetical protein [Clostridia bacterium]